MLSIEESYSAIRSTAAVIDRPSRVVVSLAGPTRMEAVRQLLAKSTEFVNANTCVDSLLLSEAGEVIGSATAIIRDEEVLVVVDADQEWFELLTTLAAEHEVTVTLNPDRKALNVEGPLSWQVVEGLTGATPVEDVLLRECVTGTLDGREVLVARSGSTAEFGYLVVADADPTATLTAAAQGLGGGLVDLRVLTRVHVETNSPVLPDQVEGCTLLEAGLGWLASLDRDDSFIGDIVTSLSAPQRRLVAAYLDGDCPEAGTPVRDGDTVVGRVQVAAPTAGQAEGLALLLLDNPYGVPGLELSVGDRTARTVSRPTIAPVSWSSVIGARS
jgi:aminomethyltransferase